MNLIDLEQNIDFETSKVEVKSILSNNPFSWLKTIAGFMNTSGGNFYIGVEDNSFKLIGFEKKEVDKVVNEFQNKIKEHISITPKMSFTYLKYVVRSKEKYIIKVYIFENEIKPIIVTFNGVPSIFVRKEGRTSPATLEEIQNMVYDSKKKEFDVVSTEAYFKKEEFTELYYFYKEQTGSELNEKILESIGFFDKDKKLYQGSILFKDDYDGDDLTLKIIVFPGFNKGSNEIEEGKVFKGNILRCLKEMKGFVDKHQSFKYQKTAFGRKEILSFPERSLTEVFVNALAHKDYMIKNAEINLFLFDDRLEVTSPGSFYKGEIVKNERNLSKLISQRRNKLISDILIRLRLMEASGTGFEKISEEYKDADLDHKPFISSTNNSFTIVLPNLVYKGGLSTDAYGKFDISYKKPKCNSKRTYGILCSCFYKYKNVNEIAKDLSLVSSSFLRQEIYSLAKENYLLTKKEGKTTYYLTNKDYVTLE